MVRSKLFTRWADQTVETLDTSTIYKTEGFLALGYDTGRFFTGAQINTYSSKRFQTDDEGSAIFNNRASFEIFIGYRFHPPGFLQKAQQFARDILPVI